MANSKLNTVKPNDRYRVVSKIRAIEGKPNSAYFAVFILNAEQKEIARLKRWINTFDGQERNYEVIFTVPPKASYVALGYRINQGTAKVSNVEAELQDIKTIQLEKYSDGQADSFDNVSGYAVPTLKRLTEKEEEGLERNIVWILGSPRSGTTWLEMLLHYGSSEYWHEPYIGWHLSQFEHWHNNIKERRYFFSMHHKKNWIPPMRSLILMRTYSQVLSLDKKVIIKEPNGSIAAEILMECLPNSKMIFLLRDGRDVIDSSIDSYRPGSWKNKDLVNKVNPLSTEAARKEAIRVHALEWKSNVEATKKAFDQHDPNLRILVRYEDLRKDTFSELKKLYKFIGVNITDGEITKIVEKYDFDKLPSSQKGPGKFNRLATPGAWKNNFSESDQALIISLIGPTLKQMGYN